MEFNFNVYNLNYSDRVGTLEKESVGEVKCVKEFPIYTKDNKEYLFKPLSKTKPFSTPLFAYSEVFWSTIINKFFDTSAPLYYLAINNGYEEVYNNRYSKGVIVESMVKNDEQLVNLLEYYRKYPDKKVDIDKYINYCCMYYDYTNILKSDIFQSRKDLGEELAKQILISILKSDINYHYENIGFIYKNNELMKIIPPIDHEYSIPFLYPDDERRNSYYFGELSNAYLDRLRSVNQEKESSKTNIAYVLKNIDLITELYPEIAHTFLSNLHDFIIEFQNTKFKIINNQNYIDNCDSKLYQVYKFEKMKKEFEWLKDLNLEEPAIQVDLDELSDNIKIEVLNLSANYYRVLKNSLDKGPRNVYRR